MATSTGSASSGGQPKGRSLADMLNEQISQGKVEAMEPDARMDTRKRYQGSSNSRYQNHYAQRGPPQNTDPNLNWQQQELVNPNYGYQNYGGNRGGYHQQGGYGRNYRGNNSNYQSQGYGNGHRGYQHQGGYPQQQQPYQQYGGYQNGGNGYQNGGNGYNHGGGQQYGNYGNVPQQHKFEPVRKNKIDRPEWADDIEDDIGANDSGALNWQQQALVNRDESDPFNSLVRGENDYSRE